MRYLIAIPCLDMVHTWFMASLLAMDRPEGTEVQICSSSLVYDSRNTLAEKAVKRGFDRVLWLDSDMVFEPDLMHRLIADMDEGRDMVCGLDFTRKAPIKPCLSRKLITHDSGRTEAVDFDSYPENAVFEVAGAGFGAMMTSVDVIRAAGAKGRPFSPIEGWGEDYSFLLRAHEAGYKCWCDSRIKVGHAGISIINEQNWKGR